MESTAVALARVNAFARAVKPDLPLVEAALEALRDLLVRAEVPYVLVGGVAVIHHGYVRATVDVDVLIDRQAGTRAEPLFDDAGFERASPKRWRHVKSGVDVDLLFAGDPIPPHGRVRFPEPDKVGRSDREADVVDLAGLMSLKLHAGRHQDVADVVALLQELNENDYLTVEAALDPQLRPRLADLRDDALEERRWRDRDNSR